jgi:hypothetical protein
LGAISGGSKRLWRLERRKAERTAHLEHAGVFLQHAASNRFDPLSPHMGHDMLE